MTYTPGEVWAWPVDNGSKWYGGMRIGDGNRLIFHLSCIRDGHFLSRSKKMIGWLPLEFIT